MAFVPGKYDDLATYVREQTQATGVIVVVIDGNKGPGFSQQWRVAHGGMPDALFSAAKALRSVADQMQSDARRLRAEQRGN